MCQVGADPRLKRSTDPILVPHSFPYAGDGFGHKDFDIGGFTHQREWIFEQFRIEMGEFFSKMVLKISGRLHLAMTMPAES